MLQNVYPVVKVVTHAHATTVTLVTVQTAPTMTSAPPVPVTLTPAVPTLTVVTNAPVTTDSGDFWLKCNLTINYSLQR